MLHPCEPCYLKPAHYYSAACHRASEADSCHPCLRADCHLPKPLRNSPHKHANNMPADITTCGQPENTLSTPSQRVWEAPSPACRAPPELGPNVMSISKSQPITVRPDLRTRSIRPCCAAWPILHCSSLHDLAPLGGGQLRLELARTSTPDACALFC
jgi:hypothetical protein